VVSVANRIARVRTMTGNEANASDTGRPRPMRFPRGAASYRTGCGGSATFAVGRRKNSPVSPFRKGDIILDLPTDRTKGVVSIGFQSISSYLALFSSVSPSQSASLPL
jgi:hypothetical protein